MCIMEVKLMVVLLVTMTLVVNDLVLADFFFNHPLPKQEDVGRKKMVCVPGRTIIKITEKRVTLNTEPDSNSEEFDMRKSARRWHMTTPTKDQSCQMCVCNDSGKKEYCSNRAADSVNECIRIKDLAAEYNAGIPYSHSRALAYRIRRDYLWHNDEIPYQAKAKCFRGHSYYSNSISANNTDIDIASEIESLLDYENEFTCFYCICSVSGEGVDCIHRDVAFCNFFREIRSDKRVRDRYTTLLQQDRPTYFRQLSWRMRRTMDNGIFDLINSVNSGNLPTTKCVPFVSEYTDCNEDNVCSGCSRCTCTSEGEWSCEEVKDCREDGGEEDEDIVEPDDGIFDNALKTLETEMNKKRLMNIKNSQHPRVPSPNVLQEQDDLLALERSQKLDEIVASLTRSRRSVATNNKHHKRSIDKATHKLSKMADSSHNNTIEHHNAVEEINEVALKDLNLTGTLVAKKLDPLPLLAGTRRTGFVDNSSKALQIDFNHPKAYNQINDNKIETVEPETKFDLSHENLKTVLGNYTQMSKNSNLSKIVVNELKKGSEIIGDANAPVTSNITFTPENDTLTAMAFIAGNLLNKLWNMEKDASTTSTETDVMKHEKIADLLDLFKEPLNIRQETFLKNALEQLSTAVDKDKNAQNISICQTITDVVHNNDTSEEDKSQVTTKAPCTKDKDKPIEEPKIKHKKAAIKAIAKINNVLDLIKKFERVQSNLSELKHGPKLIFDYNRTLPKTRKKEVENLLSKEEESSLNVFGGILEKITKLILPKKNNKKIVNLIRSQSVLLNNENNLKKKFQKMYNIDLTNMTVTAKDKIILDYLTQVDRNKDCLLKTNSNEIIESIPTIEGNILLNLSEFFKMKSFSDLIQLLEPERSKNHRSIESEKETVATTTKYEKSKVASIYKPVDTNKLNSTKEKLKAHLKTIIEDLMELQSAKGGSLKGNVKLADALPCIYNVLNAGKNEIDTKKDGQPAKSIASIFEDVKKEYKLAQTRRNFVDVTKERPKSAVLWDRLVKTLNNKANPKNRRTMNAKVPKTYNQIKKIMEKIENGSATYKHYALVVKTPPTGKLILLKALDQEVQATINVINEITLSLKELAKLPAEKFAELDEFVSNLVTSTKLTEKVDEKLKADAKKSKMNTENEISKTKPKEKQNINRHDVPQRVESDEMRISRVQIVSQLIKNRLQVFLKTKEQLNNDVRSDMSYNVARRILHYLDTGNFDLANELFKVLVSQKPNDFGMFPNGDSANDKFIVTTTPKLGEMSLRRMSILGREALLPAEDPSRRTEKHINWVNQDHLIKQLLNMKNMGL